LGRYNRTQKYREKKNAALPLARKCGIAVYLCAHRLLGGHFDRVRSVCSVVRALPLDRFGFNVAHDAVEYTALLARRTILNFPDDFLHRGEDVRPPIVPSCGDAPEMNPVTLATDNHDPALLGVG